MHKSSAFFHFLLLFTLYITFPAFSEENQAPEISCITETCEKNEYETLRGYIKDRLASYNNEFPDIFFVHLPNHDNWIGSILALELLLGYQPISLDFEHPPELAEDLLYVSIARIQKMLLYEYAAAFLFRVGEQAVAKRKNVCVISLNPVVLKNKPLHYMLALPEEKIIQIEKNLKLQGEKLLDFVIDHEAGHCLDSYFNGGVPMSEKDFWGQYKHFQREIFADIFAMSNHLQQEGESSSFISTFITFRRLCLINGDPGTCSADYLQAFLDNHSDSLQNKNKNETAKITADFLNSIDFEYAEFENYLFSAISAMQTLQVTLDESCNNLKKPEHITENKKHIQQLLNNTKHIYKEITKKDY